MPVAFRSKDERTSTATSVTFTEPAGTIQNDILFMYLVISGGMGTITGPTSWTELTSATHTGTEVTKLYWIRRGASAPNLTCSWVNSSYYDGSVVCYSGVKTSGNPYNTYADAAPSQAVPSIPDPPEVTPTVTDCMAVAFGFGWQGWLTGGATPPTDYTLRCGATPNYDTAVADKLLSSTAAENPSAFGNQAGNLDDISATTVALEPASSATFTPRSMLLGVG